MNFKQINQQLQDVAKRFDSIIELIPAQYPHSGFFLEIETKDILGDIGIWENGCIDVLLYEITTEVEIVNKSFQDKSLEQALVIVERVMQFVENDKELCSNDL